MFAERGCAPRARACLCARAVRHARGMVRVSVRVSSGPVEGPRVASRHTRHAHASSACGVRRPVDGTLPVLLSVDEFECHEQIGIHVWSTIIECHEQIGY